MYEDMKSQSAFAVYTGKRKNSKELTVSKTKKKHVLDEVLIPCKYAKVEKTVKQTSKKEQAVKDKCTLNASVKPGVIAKSLAIKKTNVKSNSMKKLTKKRNIDGKKVSRNKEHQEENEVTDKSINIQEQTEDEMNNEVFCKETDQSYILATREFKSPAEKSLKLVEWMIFPMRIKDFFTYYWEKRPVHVRRDRTSYYSYLASTEVLDKVLRENEVLFSKNIDITSYINGERETLNPVGRAIPGVVWDYYTNKCSIRMLNPQIFIHDIHALSAAFQEFFNCFVGSNLYLTPPHSQGFAPHYDDIEAFILQIEGTKRWRLYMPPTESEYLARYPSKNFDQSEIGKPILDVVLTAGDLLYFPRGTIHQAETHNSHSLHLTLSVYQKNSWCDFLEKLLPQALKQATENDNSFRVGLPLDYLKNIGISYPAKSDYKKIFKAKIKNFLNVLVNYMDLDNVADLMAKDHINDFLPPVLSWNEQSCSVIEGSKIMTANGIIKTHVTIDADTKIRLLRSHCVRLIKENDEYRIYFSTENSKEYHGHELQFVEIDEEFVPTIKKIITSYPEFIRVGDLPMAGPHSNEEEDDIKIQIVTDLWEKNLLITSAPLRVNPGKRKKRMVVIE